MPRYHSTTTVLDHHSDVLFLKCVIFTPHISGCTTSKKVRLCLMKLRKSIPKVLAIIEMLIFGGRELINFRDPWFLR